MALLTVRGRVVLESAGPDWHLVGVVKPDKMQPNQLTLSRQRDALWAKFTALGKRSLPTLKLTDTSGNSAVLTDARIIGFNFERAAMQNPKRENSQSTNEQETVALRFGKIVWEFGSSSSGSSDDWT